ncbi:hypothetical protein B0H14DRAFT_2580907 [Mycena olivaceomarginata]|nr:hypothetical protein B0H14DRAFT_2580907 [Mycena olivaceomarginata]
MPPKDPDKKYGCKVRRSLNILGLGFHLVQWDGCTPRPLIDSKGRIIAALAGQPRNDAYREAAERAFRAMREAGDEARFPRLNAPASPRPSPFGLVVGDSRPAMSRGACLGEQTTPWKLDAQLMLIGGVALRS